MINALKAKYGQKCTGIKINYTGNCGNLPVISLRLCEAVDYSFKVPVNITPETISCNGALRSFGLTQKTDKLIVEHIQKESNLSTQAIEKMLHETPCIKVKDNILLGIQEDMEKTIQPDLYILYLKPSDAMILIREYMATENKEPIIKPTTFLSVCGNIIAQTLKNDQMCLSLGCPDSSLVKTF